MYEPMTPDVESDDERVRQICQEVFAVLNEPLNFVLAGLSREQSKLEQLADNLHNQEQELEQLRSQQSIRHVQQDEIKNRIQVIEEDMQAQAQIEARLEKIEAMETSIHQTHTQLNEEMLPLQNAFSNLDNEMDNLRAYQPDEELEALEKNIQDVRQFLENFEIRHDAIQQDAEQIASNNQSLRESLLRSEKMAKALDKNNAEALAAFDNMQSQLDSMQAQAEEIERKQAQVKDTHAKVDSTLSNAETRIEHVNQRAKKFIEAKKQTLVKSLKQRALSAGKHLSKRSQHMKAKVSNFVKTNAPLVKKKIYRFADQAENYIKEKVMSYVKSSPITYMACSILAYQGLLLFYKTPLECTVICSLGLALYIVTQAAGLKNKIFRQPINR
jgi:chromosome segregation ATPase